MLDGTIAFSLGVLGHLLFVAGEIHSLFIQANSDLVILGALVSAFGILLTGIAVLMAKQWSGWTRWMPLLTGLDPSTYAIAGWGLIRLALGLAIRTQADAVASLSLTDVKLAQRRV